MDREKIPGRFHSHFPEDSKEFERFVLNYPLHINCLVAATTRVEGSWSAYCAPVKGWDHKEEAKGVLQHGDKVPQELARALFPYFDGLPYS